MADDQHGGVGGLGTTLRVADLLRGRRDENYSCPDHFSVGEAVSFLVNEQRSSALVIHKDGTIAGIFTARDLLEFVKDRADLLSPNRNLSLQLAQTKISEVMTKRDKMVRSLSLP